MSHYYVQRDAYGDLTIWREVPDRDPIAILTRTLKDGELFDLAAHNLERRGR